MSDRDNRLFSRVELHTAGARVGPGGRDHPAALTPLWAAATLGHNCISILSLAGEKVRRCPRGADEGHKNKGAL